MISSEVIILLFAGTAFFMIAGSLITFLIFRHNNRINLIHLQKNEMISESRKQHILENERMMNQISRELHDNIGQSANLVLASLKKAKRLSEVPEISMLISSASELTETVMRDARNISHSLNHNHIKARNLHALMEQDMEHMSRFSNIDFEFNISGEVRRFLPESKLIIYRIAQEAFNNILKHSGANYIILSLEYDAPFFKMSIQDNGVGLAQEEMHARQGIGLTNMHERAAVLEGKITIESNPGSGCCIIFLLKNAQFEEAS
jgi:signal transduction histidine kinase